MEFAEEKKSYSFQDFDDIKVSTKTFVVMTNMFIDLKLLFDYLPITNYTPISKKLKKKNKNLENALVENTEIETIAEGSIITLKFEDKIKGNICKKKVNNTKMLSKRGKWFRNSFTTVMIVEGKFLNFKVCQNGMFQITGCKNDEQPEKCMKYVWEYIKDNVDIYRLTRGDTFECIYIPAMRNIDFSLGFLVDREKFAQYMSNQTEFHSLLETSFGYTGVNIKIPVTKDITSMKIKKTVMFENGEWNQSEILYGDYLQYVSNKEQLKKINKKRYNTFLVFHSGKVIMSGLNDEFMRDVYYYFLNIIHKSHLEFQENLII